MGAHSGSAGECPPPLWRRWGVPPPLWGRGLMIPVTLSDAYSIEAQQLLKLRLQVQFFRSRSQSPTAEELKEARVLLVRSHTLVDRHLLELAPHLQVVGTATSGLDHIDEKACRLRDIRIFHAAEANAHSAAEHTLLLILSLLRNLDGAQKSLRGGSWRQPLSLGGELRGRTVGIIGLGRVGTRVAQLSRAFGAQVVAHDPYVGEEHFSRNHVTPMGFAEVLRQSGILTLHVPLYDETYRMLNRRSLGLLNESCVLVNTSRGEVVNEEDLIHSLRARQLAGAAVDVYSREPFVPTPQWMDTPNLILSPHIGAFTEEAFQGASMEVVEQVVGFYRRGALQGLSLSGDKFKRLARAGLSRRRIQKP